MLIKKVLVFVFLLVVACFSFENILSAQTSNKQQLQQVLITLEQLYQSKKISYNDYIQRKNKVNAMLSQLGKPSSGSTGSSKVYYDEEGKPYAFSEADCEQANFSKLNTIIKPKGFIAYPGGGYSQSDNRYFCLPCVKRINSQGKLQIEQVDSVYKPVKDIIFDYTRGASYEYCHP